MAVHSYEIDSSVVSTGDFIANEVPSGLINSSNTLFVLTNDPVMGTVIVTLNGLVQRPGIGYDYTISGKDITFTKPPRTNMDILVSYIRSEI